MNIDSITSEQVLTEIAGRTGFSQFPETGYLAGGAVANSIISICWGTQAVINDIDIFKLEYSDDLLNSDHVTDRATRRADLEEHKAFMDEDQQGYEATFREFDDVWYRIKSVERDGILNTTTLLFEDGAQLFDNALSLILRSFDLNCTMAGIDLESGQLHIEPEFVEFIKGRQLQVVNPSTPYQSFIRLFKKQKDLGCYVDYELEARMLKSCIDNADHFCPRSSWYKNDGALHHQYYKFIGPKHLAYFFEHKSDVEKYCSVKTVSLKSGPRNVEQDFSNLFYCLEFRGHSDWSVMSSMRESFISITHFKRCWEKLYRPTVRKYARELFSEIIGCDFELFSALVKIKEIDSLRLSGKQIKYIDKTLNGHTLLTKRALRQMPAEKLYPFAVFLRRLEREYGRWVYGVLETGSGRGEFLLTDADAMTAAIVKAKGKLSDHLLAKPLKISAFKSQGVTITELTTGYDLVVEGAVMKHCVGGYMNDVAQHRCRIFHLNVDGEESTLEVRINVYHDTKIAQIIRQPEKVVSFKQGQHFLECNKRVSKRSREVAIRFVRWLNENARNEVVPEALGCLLVKQKTRLKSCWRDICGVARAVRQFGLHVVILIPVIIFSSRARKAYLCSKGMMIDAPVVVDEFHDYFE